MEQRMIKFRSWNTIHRVMTNNFTLMDCMDDTQIFVLPESFVFMQYTGLNDKNGVEVYQGDILKITADKEGYGSTSYGGFAEVIPKTCGFSLQLFNPTISELDEQWYRGGDGYDSSSLWHAGDPENIEVIGNIYENPELLEANP